MTFDFWIDCRNVKLASSSALLLDCLLVSESSSSDFPSGLKIGDSPGNHLFFHQQAGATEGSSGIH